jgi:hypothetical protein
MVTVPSQKNNNGWNKNFLFYFIFKFRTNDFDKGGENDLFGINVTNEVD